MTKFYIGSKGGGKGGGSQRTPVEDKDSLRSRAYAKLIDVVSEGQIGGLVDGLKSIYLDDVPLQNTDGSYNFEDVAVEFKDGSIGQSVLSNMDGVDSTQSINVALKYNIPAVRTINSPEADYARVSIAVGQLSTQNTSNGDVHGTSVAHRIEYRANGGAWQTVKTDVIEGKTMSGYERSVTFKLTGSAPWDVRITRTTADSASQALQNASKWSTLTSVIADKFRFPSTALVGMQINAEQFSSIPTRAYHLKGLVIKVPANYDPATRVYSGAWNGTFKMAWTDNPVWCLYDLLTNERYGLGTRIDAGMIDKWELYQIAQYCDQLVPDGHGGMEPRFTCNLYLQTRAEAYKFIQDMAAIFRGISYWASGSIAVKSDMSSPVRYQFNNSNVENGVFERAGSNIQTRHNVALVTWNAPADMGRQKIEYVEDFDAIQKMGYVSETEVAAFGCTSQGQAHRLGEWLLYTEQYESEIVSFTAGADGAIPLPSDVIQISDVYRAGERRGGRVLAGSSKTSVKLDAPVTLATGKTYTLSTIDVDGGFQSATVTTGAGSHATLAVTPFAKDIAENATWILSDATLTPEIFKVIGVDEVENGKYKISCLSHNPSKYGYIEREQALTAPQTSNLQDQKPDVANVVVTEVTATDKNDIPINKLNISWKPANAVSTAFFVEYRTDSGAWQRTPTSSQYFAEISPVAENVTYQIRVVAGNRLLGVWSNPQAIEYTPIAYQVPAITNLVTATAWSTGQDVTIKWDVVNAKAYEVQVLEGATVRRTIKATESTYTYTAQDYKADGCNTRSLTFKVRAISSNGRTGAWSQVVATNAQVGALQGISVTSGMRKAYFECVRPADSDFAGLIVWVGATANFTPSDTNKVYDGSDTLVVLSKLTSGTEMVAGVTYYLKCAGYDTFGKDALAVSNSTAFTVSANVPDANTIHAQMIQDGVLTTAKFAQGIEPVTIVSGASLPTVKSTNTITWNNKLYYWSGTAYVAKVNAVDVQGQLTSAQIASLDATKVAGQLTDAQLANISAAKLTGQVVATQIADAAISTTKFASGIQPVTIVSGSTLPTVKLTDVITMGGKLYRWSGTAYTAQVPAADLAGQIVNTQIADDAITTPKLAANSVVAGKLAANSVVAGNVSADAVTAGTIAAGAISAREIAANAITASKLIIGDTTNAYPDSNIDDIAFYSTDTGTLALVATNTTYLGKNYLRLSNPNSNAWSAWFPVEPSAAYWFAMRAAVGTATNGIAEVGVEVGTYDATGAISVTRTIQFGQNSTTSYATEYSQNVNTTSNERIARLYFKYIGVDGKTNTTARFGGFKVLRRATGQLIVDGAILANHLSADSVTANAIASNSVTADAIAANAITAVKISAGAITAGKLAADSVVASNIATGAVTADAMAANSVTANKIQAGAVNATHIAADSITSAQIAAGAINTEELAAGAITATKIAISDVTNLYPDMDMIDPSFYTSGGAVTFIGTTSTPLGQNYLELSGVATVWSGWFPVDPSAEFYVTALAWVSAVAAGNSAVVGVDFGTLASNGTVTQSRSITLGTNSAGWNATTSKFVTDVTTTSGERRMRFWVQNVGSASQARAGGFRVQRKANGSLLVDGCITSDKVVAGAISGDKIAANAITADKVVANAITSDKIAANAITADKVVANAITSDKIAANAVTANHINVTNLEAVNANTGNLKATGAIYGGGYTTAHAGNNDTWPASGVTGFALSANGLKIGNKTNNKFIRITPDGNLYAPTWSSVNGKLTINELDVIDTLNIKDNAVSSIPSASRVITDTALLSDYTTILSLSVSVAKTREYCVFASCLFVDTPGDTATPYVKIYVDGIQKHYRREDTLADVNYIASHAFAAGQHNIRIDVKGYQQGTFSIFAINLMK